MSKKEIGFSTLNRWLGRKNKEKSTSPNGKLSKSSTNLSLSISTTNINEASQLDYNRIAPLPAVTSNAPFEQTFRITVLLPKDQLYVARLGARVPLSKLLELVCDHKSLDAQKYEFRNPVDPSQIYSCDLTIGAVGLSEIRLCHKSDSYESYNTDEMMKLHRTSVIRDSLSSSEFSSRNSKHTTKTASPYSSSNSLNSMDSTGMNYTRTPVSPPPALPKTAPPNIVVPPRKKRAAPRPPSQVVIPEKAALVIEQEAQQTEQTIEQLKQQQDAMSMPGRKDYYASTPNLNSNTSADLNGNTSPSTTTPSATNGNIGEDEENQTEAVYAQVAQKNARNLYGGSVQNLSTTSPVEETKNLPEPSPRKRLIQLKKKSAPAPPPRGSSIINGDDTISIASTTFSTPDTPNTADSEKSMPFHEQEFAAVPIPVVRESSSVAQQPLQCSTPVLETQVETPTSISIPKPVPRLTTTTLLNATSTEHNTPSSPTQHINVSKVLLNRTPTPEPRSISCEPSDSEGQPSSLPVNTNCEEDDNVSKQADSGIGEPVPSPIPDSLPSEGSTHECKSAFESSSDDDDMVKTYNCKLGKTVVKATDNASTTTTLEQLRVLQLNSGEITPGPMSHEPTPNAAETTSWNFAIPISPPPNFADNSPQLAESTSTDAPITPKIVERPVLIFDQLNSVDPSKDVADHSAQKIDTPVDKCPRTPLPSPSTPINEIIDELSTILNQNRMDTLIKKHDEHTEIESAKPSTLSNFTITTLSTQQIIKSVDARSTIEPTTPESVSDEEKLYKKRNSITNGNNAIKQQRKSVTRADSFHTTSAANGTPNQNTTKADSTNGLNSRSSSYLSLTKLDQSNGLNRRRSSSELSIGESPSLQSLEVIKTILNSRKNSLANSSDGESKTPSVEIINVEIKPTTVTAKVENVDLKPKVEKSIAQTKPEEPEKPKEVPKIYRYSGPPSINFSTWSERPKVQVAIKNEGDYIFGGKNAGTQNAAVTRADVEIRSIQTVPRSQRLTMPAALTKEVFKPTSPPAVAPKPIISSTIERMGIPEKEYNVPVLVKPLKDVTVENFELRKSNVKTSEPNVTKIMLNGDREMIKKSGTTITTISTNQRQFTHASDTSTLPRAGNASSRFSMPSNSTINLLRSTSITKLEQKNSTNTESVCNAPFGQNTLRKTGLKEKILAKEEQQQKQQQTDVKINSTNSTQSENGIIASQQINRNFNNGTVNIINRGSTTKTTKTLQSSKLELKLQQSPQVFAIQQNGSLPSQSLRATTPKSAPPAPTPPAPPMPVLKSVTLRSKSTSAATTPTNEDQRDALLSAIRNFRRDDLTKV